MTDTDMSDDMTFLEIQDNYIAAMEAYEKAKRVYEAERWRREQRLKKKEIKA